MKLLSITLLSLLYSISAQSSSQTSACNKPGYYGPNCNYACSDGCPTKIKSNFGLTKCDPKDGFCTDENNQKVSKCEDKWENDDAKMCDQPLCFGSNGCDEGGKCIAPDYCICGESGAQTVGMYKEYEINGERFTGTNCVSLRRSGLKGAFVALAVMTVSIGLCGFIERAKNGPGKRKNY